MAAASAFAQTLRRYTSLNHLAQAARAVLQNTAQINQMLSDLNRVDFANVQVPSRGGPPKNREKGRAGGGGEGMGDMLGLLLDGTWGSGQWRPGRTPGLLPAPPPKKEVKAGGLWDAFGCCWGVFWGAGGKFWGWGVLWG